MIHVLFDYLANKELLTTEFDLEKAIIEIVGRKNINDFGDFKPSKDNIFIWFIIFNHYFDTFMSDNQHSEDELIFDYFQKNNVETTIIDHH